MKNQRKPFNVEPAADQLSQKHLTVLQAADELRRRIAERIGSNLDCSSRYVCEDRER